MDPAHPSSVLVSFSSTVSSTALQALQTHAFDSAVLYVQHHPSPPKRQFHSQAPHSEPPSLAALLALCARSCSMICRLQYRLGKNLPGYTHIVSTIQMSKSLSCWEAPRFARSFGAHLRHLVPELAVGAHAPRHGGDTEDDAHHDGRVGAPVGRLCVPAAGGRPDVLGVAVCGAAVSHFVPYSTCGMDVGGVRTESCLLPLRMELRHVQWRCFGCSSAGGGGRSRCWSSAMSTDLCFQLDGLVYVEILSKERISRPALLYTHSFEHTARSCESRPV